MLKAHLDPPCKQGLYVMDNLRHNSQMGPMDSSMTRSGILSHLKIPHMNYDKRPYFFCTCSFNMILPVFDREVWRR